jgi:hypothetical protein
MQNKTVSIIKLSQNEINTISGGGYVQDFASWASYFAANEICAELPSMSFEKMACFISAKTVGRVTEKIVKNNWGIEDISLLAITITGLAMVYRLNRRRAPR